MILFELIELENKFDGHEFSVFMCCKVVCCPLTFTHSQKQSQCKAEDRKDKTSNTQKTDISQRTREGQTLKQNTQSVPTTV